MATSCKPQSRQQETTRARVIYRIAPSRQLETTGRGIHGEVRGRPRGGGDDSAVRGGHRSAAYFTRSYGGGGEAAATTQRYGEGTDRPRVKRGATGEAERQRRRGCGTGRARIGRVFHAELRGRPRGGDEEGDGRRGEDEEYGRSASASTRSGGRGDEEARKMTSFWAKLGWEKRGSGCVQGQGTQRRRRLARGGSEETTRKLGWGRK